jgi:MarR family transcriptional regulator, organic hydroperoxide resistance regulator
MTTFDAPPLLASRAFVPLKQQLCFSLYAATLAMSKAYKKLLKEHKLTYAQFMVMLVLWEHDHQTISDLGTTLCMESATLLPIIRKLESNGFVSRSSSTIDQLQLEVGLTVGGRKLQESTKSIPACVLETTGCEPHTVQLLADQLEVLRKNLMVAHAML